MTRQAFDKSSILQRCRDRIDREATQQEHRNLLAVTQVLTKLRFPDPHLLTLFGGRQTMIDSPLIHELMAEKTQQDILLFLQGRFGEVSEGLSARLKSVSKMKTLEELIKVAAQCSDLKSFETSLPVERQRPASTRKTARPRKDTEI